MNSPVLGDSQAAGGARAGVQVFPVAIGHYGGFPDLDVDVQVGRVLDLLAPFGAWHQPWAAPALDRGAGAVERRLLEWADAGNAADVPPGSVLYWVGHGWSDGTLAALAHADSPPNVGAAGVTPERLAYAIRARQALVQARGSSDEEGGGWALVVVDTCQSKRFAELLGSQLKARDQPQGVILVGVSGDGATTLGRFTSALRTALTTTYKATSQIPLTDLAYQFHRLLPGCEVCPLGDLTDARLVPVFPPVASWMSAPLDTIRHLEETLNDLGADERRHFLVKAQSAEHGEVSWFFEGRHQERGRIVSWLRHAGSGMLVVTGRAGSGKSALLGNVLVHSLPELRDALARRGLITALLPRETPPDGVFDAVIHLSGLTLPQATRRLAAAAQLGPLPPRDDPAAGIATDLDWLTARLAERAEPFTVLADALDEATDPLDTARSLLARISAVPGVRVLVGTRASTNETPDALADDENLLDALAASPPVPDQPDPGSPGDPGTSTSEEADGTGPLWVTRDADAIGRYVARRLKAAREHGVAGKAVPDMNLVQNQDIDRVAAVVAGRDREFLFARLAVYELVKDPRLLTLGRSRSLSILLEGDHQDLFAKALGRLAQLDDRYPVLVEALSLARGRGMPEADGIWATVAAALTPETTRPDTLTTTHPMDSTDTDTDAEWAQSSHDLLEHAAAYIVVDSVPADLHDVGHGYQGETDGIGETELRTVYRLAHRTFVEYFTGIGTQRDRRRRAAAALLHSAARIAATDPSRMPAYLARHLSGHAAEADMWDDLVGYPCVLDGLDPHAVTADALRTLFGRRSVPPPVAGIIGARDALTDAALADRPGLRHLATTIHSPQHVIDEPATSWGIAAAQAGQATVHVRLSGHTGVVSQVLSLTLPDRRIALASASDDSTIRLWDPGTATPIGTPLTGNASTVEDICVLTTPDGRTLLASVGRDGTVRIWDPGTGRQVGEAVVGHVGGAYAVCTVADGHPGERPLLASAGRDGTVRVWDPATGRQVGDALVGHAGGVWTVCAVADGHPGGRTLLASAGDDGTVRVWDRGTGRQVGDALVGHAGTIWAVCAVADGHPGGRTLLASAGDDGTVRIWDPGTGRQIGDALTGHTGDVWDVCAVPGPDPGGRNLLASAGGDGTVRVWDPGTGRQIGDALTGHVGAIWGVCAVPGRDPGGRSLLASAGGDGTVRVWDPGTGQQVGDAPAGRAQVGHSGAIFEVCALPGGDPNDRTLLANSAHDGTIRIWDPDTGRQVGDALVGHTGAVFGVCTLPGRDPGGRNLLASAAHDGTVRVWDPGTGRQVGDALTGHVGAVWDVCAVPSRDPGGRNLLASAGRDGTVRVWDRGTGRQVGDALTGHVGAVLVVCAVADRDPGGALDGPILLASAGDDGTVRVWDPGTGRQVGDALTGHVGAVWDVCAVPGPDPGGRNLLASAGEDGTVRVWNPDTGRQVGDALTGHTGAIFGMCAVTDLDSGGALDGPILLASAGEDGTVRVWDPGTGRQVGDALTGHVGAVWDVCAVPGRDPGGRNLLASAGEDGTVRVWDPGTGRAVGEPLAWSPNTVNGLAPCVSAIADCLTVNGDETVHAWTAATASIRAMPSRPHVSALLTLASPDHTAIVVGDAAGQVYLSDLGTHRGPYASLRVNHGAILALCLLPGKPARVAAATSAGIISVITLATGLDAGPVLRGHSGPVRDLCLTERPDGSPLLASAGTDATLRIWDLDTWAQYAGPLTGHDGWIWSLTALPAGPGPAPQLASAGADHTIRIWDPVSCRPVGEPLTGHTDQVRAVTTATSSDGRTLLVSGSHDGTVRLWHSGTRTPVYTIPIGIPIHALLRQQPDPRSRERTNGGATVTVGLRTGILTLDLDDCLFPAAPEPRSAR